MFESLRKCENEHSQKKNLFFMKKSFSPILRILFSFLKNKKKLKNELEKNQKHY